MEYKLPLPCSPADVENFILSHCPHYGYDNCQVSSDGDNLIITYDELTPPSKPPTKSPDQRGRIRC